MDIVGRALVGGEEGDPRLERGWAARRHLQPVEPAPGDPHHADGAGAPALPGKPGDDLETVVLLLLQVLVVEEPIGLAAAAHVDAHTGIAVARGIRMRERVALGGAV